jgi:hypothetical protein
MLFCGGLFPVSSSACTPVTRLLKLVRSPQCTCKSRNVYGWQPPHQLTCHCDYHKHSPSCLAPPPKTPHPQKVPRTDTHWLMAPRPLLCGGLRSPTPKVPAPPPPPRSPLPQDSLLPTPTFISMYFGASRVPAGRPHIRLHDIAIPQTLPFLPCTPPPLHLTPRVSLGLTITRRWYISLPGPLKHHPKATPLSPTVSPHPPPRAPPKPHPPSHPCTFGHPVCQLAAPTSTCFT